MDVISIGSVLRLPCLSPSDVISIEKTGEHFRLIYDVKGRFTVHRITAEEAKVGFYSSAWETLIEEISEGLMSQSMTMTHLLLLCSTSCAR